MDTTETIRPAYSTPNLDAARLLANHEAALKSALAAAIALADEIYNQNPDLYNRLVRASMIRRIRATCMIG